LCKSRSNQQTLEGECGEYHQGEKKEKYKTLGWNGVAKREMSLVQSHTLGKPAHFCRGNERRTDLKDG